MTKLVYLADYVDGQLKIRGRKAFDEDIKNSGFKVFKITIEKAKAKRSLSQNAYYHAAVVPIVQQGLKDLGIKFSKEQTHEMLKLRFLKEEIPINEHGEFITRIKSTTDLNKLEFSDYIEEIIQWSSEYLNVIIEPPLKQTMLNYDL